LLFVFMLSSTLLVFLVIAFLGSLVSVVMFSWALLVFLVMFS
jgi:hypothetical protein